MIGVSFVSGAIKVLLKAEDGKERVSTRYDHEDRHRWVPGRSLVLGKLPPTAPKVKQIELRIYLEEFYGARHYVTLEKDQVLPNNGRNHIFADRGAITAICFGKEFINANGIEVDGGKAKISRRRSPRKRRSGVGSPWPPVKKAEKPAKAAKTPAA